MNGRTFRWAAFATGLVFLSVGTLPFRETLTVADPGFSRVPGFFSMAIGLGLCRGFFPPCDRWKSRLGLGLLLGLFVLPRILLWPAAPTDDVHRYRWEGRLVLNGQNPYATTADDPALGEWRDRSWDRMNHKDRGTVYPPVAQMIFAGMAFAEEKVPRLWLEKGVFLACDFGIFLLVLLLLRRRNLPPSFVLFYAVNPVVLVSFAAEAHYDALFVLPMVGAVYALETGRIRLSWLLLALSVQIKLISLVLVSAWLYRRAWRGAWIAASVIALTWLPFMEAVPRWGSAVFEFGGNSAFFGLIPYLLRTAGFDQGWAAWAGGAFLMGGLLWIVCRGGPPATVARRVVGVLLICSPILHFWYLTWLIPFLALRPSLSWLWLCAAQGFYFFVWETQAATGVWALPQWVEPVVWLPFLLLGLGEGVRLLGRGRYKARAGGETVGVVIPAYNVESCLRGCLRSIRQSSVPPEEIVVVDGGSSDGTVALARKAGVRVVGAPLGRGAQIQRGLEELRTDWALVVHADCLLDETAVEKIRGLGPEVVGGACGQRFEPSGALLSVVEFMNEGRAVHGESYWGDQAQFFRLEFRELWADLEEYPLMEDVELSRRLRRIGETVYLGLPTRADTGKWRPGGRARRFRLVFSAVIRFRIACLLGSGRDAAKNLYAEYYGKRIREP